MDPLNCILLLGGNGNRFGSSLPKQFHIKGSEPLFSITASKLLKSFDLKCMVLSVPVDYLKHEIFTAPLERLQAAFNLEIKCISGGKTRHESLLNARSLLDNKAKVTMIHDANRPYLTSEFCKGVNEAVKMLDHYDAVIPILSMVDSICSINNEGEVTGYNDRSILKRIQTPQLCKTSILLSLPKHSGPTPTDEGSWFLSEGFRVGTYPGDAGNKKVTFKEDFTNE